jgi:hypothetical protein
MSATSSGIIGTEIPYVFMDVVTDFLNNTCLDKFRRVGKTRETSWFRNVVLIMVYLSVSPPGFSEKSWNKYTEIFKYRKKIPNILRKVGTLLHFFLECKLTHTSSLKLIFF